jgi:hypothetical protein
MTKKTLKIRKQLREIPIPDTHSVLSRSYSNGQTITIGDIKIYICGSEGAQKTRVSIVLPRHVEIVRDGFDNIELLDIGF